MNIAYMPYKSGYQLKIKLTHQDFADMIASTRETVTATLSKLKNQDIIDYEDKYVVIKSVEQVRVVAEEGSPR